MKYVAFLDILGFKNKLKGLSQNEARSFMGKFSSIVYHDFQVKSEEINGLVVSDSVILSTKDVKQDSLKSLVNLVLLICKDEFAQNGILLRGAIAKGEFDEMPARELKNLRKELIVGQAYVDAYLLENSVKTIGINLSKDVYDDLQNCGQNVEITEEKIKKETKDYPSSLVRVKGLEPPRLAALDPKSNVSTSSTIPAMSCKTKRWSLFLLLLVFCRMAKVNYFLELSQKVPSIA